MRIRPLLFLVMLLSGVALAQQNQAVETAEGRELKGYSAQGGEGVQVYEVPIGGTIDLGLAPFVERVVRQANAADVILLRIKTFGGRVDAAVRIRDALLGADATVVAYIDQRAISAGALISLAADTIIMSQGASIGAATPVQSGGGGEMQPTSEKVVSYMRAEMRATAEATGRRADIAEAMVDADVQIEGITAEGKLLTLTSAQALEYGIADAVTDSYQDVFELLNLQAAERVEAATHWGEKIARTLTDPVISSLLMTFGVLGLLLEFYTPGFGIGGFIGITCLFLFFFGQYAANLAGWEEVILFGVGAILLILEIFVIPGFGVAGILGIVTIAVALVMALVELEVPWEVARELGYVQEAANRVLIRLGVLIVAIIGGTILFGRYFPGSFLGRGIVLSDATKAVQGYSGQSDELVKLLGKRGVALGVLRPSGIAEIDGRRVDVVSEGQYITKGSAIEVIQVDGNRVVVKKV